MDNTDTSMARGSRFFPDTAMDTEPWPVKMDVLATRYWRPVYLHLRIRWKRSNEEAKDLTQEFFARLLDRDIVDSFRPDRARFRTFLRAVLDNFVREEGRTRSRLKRGGGQPISNLEEAEESASPADDPFTAAWRHEVLDEALLRLERAAVAAGVPMVHEAVRRYYLHPAPEDRTYATVAREFGLSLFDLTNLLKTGRKWLRELVVEVVRGTVSDPKELPGEIDELFGGVHHAGCL